MDYPKISIVTPSYNQGKYLEQTILSIINQKYPNLEYIIIDGGSTDNSIKIIKKYEKHLTYWVSEKDKGQSDAINKGLKKVTGDLFNWINSDDYLEEGALFEIASAFQKNPDKKLFCFGLNYLKGNEKELSKLKNNPSDPLQCFYDPVIAQPAAFFSSEAIKKIGMVNLRLHYSMDYEWWLKCMFLFGNECLFVSHEPVASFRIHDEAKTSEGDKKFVNDMANILHSLSAKANLHEYSALLEEIFEIDKLYNFSLPLKTTDSTIIERMVIYFLLKWKKNIYTKKDFLSVKIIINKIDFRKLNLSEKEIGWLREMRKNSQPSSWLQFRAKRKIRHIFSK